MALFYWPNIDKESAEYVSSCDTCQLDKALLHKKYQLLPPVYIIYQPWSSILMDCIVSRWESEGCSRILVIIDHVTNMADFMLLKTQLSIQDLA